MWTLEKFCNLCLSSSITVPRSEVPYARGTFDRGLRRAGSRGSRSTKPKYQGSSRTIEPENGPKPRSIASNEILACSACGLRAKFLFSCSDWDQLLGSSTNRSTSSLLRPLRFAPRRSHFVKSSSVQAKPLKAADVAVPKRRKSLRSARNLPTLLLPSSTCSRVSRVLEGGFEGFLFS